MQTVQINYFCNHFTFQQELKQQYENVQKSFNEKDSICQVVEHQVASLQTELDTLRSQLVDKEQQNQVNAAKIALSFVPIALLEYSDY